MKPKQRKPQEFVVYLEDREEDYDAAIIKTDLGYKAIPNSHDPSVLTEAELGAAIAEALPNPVPFDLWVRVLPLHTAPEKKRSVESRLAKVAQQFANETATRNR